MYFYIKYIGKLSGLTTEFQQSMEFETGEFERLKFDCIYRLIKIFVFLKRCAFHRFNA